MPITWKNVSGGGGGGAAALFKGASDSFDSAADNITGIFDELKATKEYNEKNTIKNNTNEFLDMIRTKYKTPEELAAARKSGEIDAAREQYGFMIDRDKAIGAAKNREKALKDEILTNEKWNDDRLTRSERPELEEAFRRAYAGDKKGALEVMEGYDAPDAMEQQQKLQSVFDRNLKQKRETYNFNRGVTEDEWEDEEQRIKLEKRLSGEASKNIRGQVLGSALFSGEGKAEYIRVAREAGVDEDEIQNTAKNWDAYYAGAHGITEESATAIEEQLAPEKAALDTAKERTATPASMGYDMKSPMSESIALEQLNIKDGTERDIDETRQDVKDGLAEFRASKHYSPELEPFIGNMVSRIVGGVTDGWLWFDDFNQADFTEKLNREADKLSQAMLDDYAIKDQEAALAAKRKKLISHYRGRNLPAVPLN